MAGTRIVCPIYTVNLGSARSDLVAKWLARQTLKPAVKGRFLGGQISYNMQFIPCEPSRGVQRSSSDKAYIFPSWHDYKHQIFKLP